MRKCLKNDLAKPFFETDKTLTPFRALKVSKKGIDGGSILFAEKGSNVLTIYKIASLRSQ